MTKKLFLFSLFLFYAPGLFANPSPLGIELNKATLDDVKKSYRIVKTELNDNKGYHNHFLDVRNISMDTLSSAIVVTNEHKIVEGIILVLSKNKFDEMYKSLSGKYKVLSKDIKFVGDQYVKLQEGDSHIIVNAPHMSFEMQIIYVTKHFENMSYERADKEEKAKQEQIDKML